MERKRGRKVLICFLLAVFISQSLEVEFGDEKNYYSPDPHVVTPPSHMGVSPPKHSHRTPACPPPPQGGSGCSCATPPPHGGGGGYYNSPPPTVPVGPPTPTTPSIVRPPSPPLVPSPPFVPVDPNSPPFTPAPGTCIFWSMNPTMIWSIFGYWTTIGGLFSPATTLPFGRNLSVQEALENTRTDGFGSLYREGTASFLNSMVNKKFPFTTPEVRHAFASSLVSEKAASDQARIFKLANEGRFKKH